MAFLQLALLESVPMSRPIVTPIPMAELPTCDNGSCHVPKWQDVVIFDYLVLYFYGFPVLGHIAMPCTAELNIIRSPA